MARAKDPHGLRHLLAELDHTDPSGDRHHHRHQSSHSRSSRRHSIESRPAPKLSIPPTGTFRPAPVPKFTLKPSLEDDDSSSSDSDFDSPYAARHKRSHSARRKPHDLAAKQFAVGPTKRDAPKPVAIPSTTKDKPAKPKFTTKFHVSSDSFSSSSVDSIPVRKSRPPIAPRANPDVPRKRSPPIATRPKPDVRRRLLPSSSVAVTIWLEKQPKDKRRARGSSFAFPGGHADSSSSSFSDLDYPRATKARRAPSDSGRVKRSPLPIRSSDSDDQPAKRPIKGIGKTTTSRKAAGQKVSPATGTTSSEDSLPPAKRQIAVDLPPAKPTAAKRTPLVVATLPDGGIDLPSQKAAPVRAKAQADIGARVSAKPTPRPDNTRLVPARAPERPIDIRSSDDDITTPPAKQAVKPTAVKARPPPTAGPSREDVRVPPVKPTAKREESGGKARPPPIGGRSGDGVRVPPAKPSADVGLAPTKKANAFPAVKTTARLPIDSSSDDDDVARSAPIGVNSSDDDVDPLPPKPAFAAKAAPKKPPIDVGPSEDPIGLPPKRAPAKRAAQKTAHPAKVAPPKPAIDVGPSDGDIGLPPSKRGDTGKRPPVKPPIDNGSSDDDIGLQPSKPAVHRADSAAKAAPTKPLIDNGSSDDDIRLPPSKPAPAKRAAQKTASAAKAVPKDPSIDIDSLDDDIGLPPSKPPAQEAAPTKRPIAVDSSDDPVDLAPPPAPPAKTTANASIGDDVIRFPRLTANSSDEDDLDLPGVSSALKAAVQSNLPIDGGSSDHLVDVLLTEPDPANPPPAVVTRPSIDVARSDGKEDKISLPNAIASAPLPAVRSSDDDLAPPPAKPAKATAVKPAAAGPSDDEVDKPPTSLVGARASYHRESRQDIPGEEDSDPDILTPRQLAKKFLDVPASDDDEEGPEEDDDLTAEKLREMLDGLSLDGEEEDSAAD